MRELLIGCGSRREKILSRGSNSWVNLTTLDINPTHNPDIVHDLNELPLPFEADTFDEIHAYEVLEHTGRQGDAKFFFGQFSEFWRILKPDSVLCATVPHWQSPWAWGDPSHTRVIQIESLFFLSQPHYTERVGKSPMSDFRDIYKADFNLEWSKTDNGCFMFVLRAVKPSRIMI